MEQELGFQISNIHQVEEPDVEVKINNPKSALSYLEISQLRTTTKQANVGGSTVGNYRSKNTSIPNTAVSISGLAVFGGGVGAGDTNKYFCNNCNRTNHVYNNCRAPITSIGVIAFRCGDTGPEFLMIRRRDSFGFVDFIRGKYSLNDEAYIQRIIDEMTMTEKSNLLRLTFEQLWRLLWGEYTRGSQYKNEEHISFEKYRQVLGGIRTKDGRIKTLHQFIDESTTRWTETEWGFPKGRRNYNEKDLPCALRECLEETGYDIGVDNVIQNIAPFEEIFMGSDMKCYKQKYFLAMVDLDKKPKKAHDIMEVGLMKWMTFEECISTIRPYNLEKIGIVSKINNILSRYRIF
jgi:ADP-ribose pyrophosphatase YjhB (NUDIX family)